MIPLPRSLRPFPSLAVILLFLAVVGCSPAPSGRFAGYVEAEYVRVGGPLAGALARLDVARGDTVAVGSPLFALESAQEAAARAEAESRLVRARAELADLEKAGRPAEVAAARAQLDQAKAVLVEAENDLERTQRLFATNVAPASQLETATATRDARRARVAELEAQLELIRMPARADRVRAARAGAKAAADVLDQAQWRLDQKTQRAPAAARVVDTLFEPGEWVPAGAPVVTLLPPANVKVRFFVPEPALAGLHVGDPVTIHLDGGDPVAAAVTFIAPDAEFTPPVLYTRENRAMLVFLVEARPNAFVAGLHPGLPVEVAPGAGAHAAR